MSQANLDGFPSLDFSSVILSIVSSCLVVLGFVMLFETYSKQKKKVTKAEHKEILKYARSRYVLCMY